MTSRRSVLLWVLGIALYCGACSDSRDFSYRESHSQPSVATARVQLRHTGETSAQTAVDLTVGQGIPDGVVAFRVSGLDDVGTLVYPTVEVARARDVVLEGVPLDVSRLLIQYVDGNDAVLARHLRRVQLQGDATLEIPDSDVHAHLLQDLSEDVPCVPLGGAGFFDDWKPLFQGISYTEARYEVAFADCKTKRIQVAHALRIDLLDPDIGFVLTEALPDQPGYTQSGTATDFLLAHQNDPGYLPVKIALNSNFFTPCCQTTSSPPPAKTVQLRGLSISEGKPVNPDDLNVDGSGDPGAMSAFFERVPGQPGLSASFQVVTSETDPTVWAGVDTAIAGGNGNPNGVEPPTQYLVHQGILKPDPKPPKILVAARTTMGFSKELTPRFMYVVTVDGEAGETSTYGSANFDSACWLKLAGAWDGINLDGGGSTTLAMAHKGGAQPIGRPHGDEKTACLERLVGSVMGIRANPVSNQVLPGDLSCGLFMPSPSPSPSP